MHLYEGKGSVFFQFFAFLFGYFNYFPYFCTGNLYLITQKLKLYCLSEHEYFITNNKQNMKDFEGLSNETLALLYVGGNNRAFDELLERTQSKLFAYIMFVVRNEDVANDIFQETFVKVITRLQEGRYTDSGKFTFWLTRIAHNAIMDWYRAQKSDRIVDLADENDLSNLSGEMVLDSYRENEMVNDQVMQDVRKLMEALPAAQREVVFMRFYQQLSFKEIAEVTGVSINTSLGRMRYALMNLRKMAKENQMELALQY